MKTKKPFFVRYLEKQDLDQISGAKTTKYPSDSDDADRTLKYPSDNDEILD